MKIKQPFPLHKNRGIALLLMLSLLIIVLTTVAIARLSLNDLAQTRQATTLKTLTETRDAIMAWTLTQNFSPTNPPGTLPCPDINFDGVSDKPTINCSSELGFVPYRTLGIAEPRDGDGALLWYAVSNFYTRSVDVTLGQFRNSSLASPLRLNNPTTPVAFVLVSQNDAVAGQNRGNVSVANRGQFLEGTNADNNFNDYSDQFDQMHNDTIVAMPVGVFWSAVEEVVLSHVKKLLQTYSLQCGSYPWAVTFSDPDDNSDNNVREGRVPLGIALPTNWAAGCAPPMLPWLPAHWSKMFYYSMCSPISSLCLQLKDANNTLLQTASVMIIAPGIPLSGYTRPPGALINQFFENQNETVNDDVYQLTPSTNHTNTFNDVIKRVAP